MRRIPFWPQTRAGWWATAMMAVFGGMFLINGILMNVNVSALWWMNAILPYYGIAMIACMLAGSITGVVAWRRAHDTSFAVVVTMLPLVGLILLIIGEFAFPH